VARKRKPTVQECVKRYAGRCFFFDRCGVDDYALLDAHRIFEGERGGTYAWDNLVVLCASCHRMVTAGIIRIHRRYQSTGGTFIHWTDRNGVEHYTPERGPRGPHGPPG
jgi:hypothetical protein